jgi:hypothetical protein
MTSLRIAVMALLLICAFAVATRAQQFSAIGVAHDPTGHVVKSKIYISGGKVRLDPQEAASAKEQAYTILDLMQRTATVVNNGQKISMLETPGQARQSLQFYSSGVPPCPPTGATCKNDGQEAVNGRNAEKWELTQSMQGQVLLTRIWVDSKLHIGLG